MGWVVYYEISPITDVNCHETVYLEYHDSYEAVTQHSATLVVIT